MKKRLMIPICLMLVTALAACSPGVDHSHTSESTPSAQTAEPADQTGDTITVEDMKGQVEIPANPQRIVDVSGLVDELIILDMPFIASANTSMYDGITVPDYLQEYFTHNKIEIVGNYSGAAASGDLNLEKKSLS